MGGTSVKQKGKAGLDRAFKLKRALGTRSIVLVGLMGCGKSSVGKRLANRLAIPFTDADNEIELAAGKSIPDIFADYGEVHFRDRESLIVRRLLESGPQVLATGGGAFMREDTREAIKSAGVSVWIRAELDILLKRVMRRDNRPLLKTADPAQTMRDLIAARHPVYALADVTVESRDTTHEVVVDDIMSSLVNGPLVGKREE